MLCPKCGKDNAESNILCQSCGVVFAKLRAIEERKKNKPEINIQQPTSTTSALLSKLISVPERNERAVILLRAVLLIGLIIWSFTFIFSSVASNNAGQSFLHQVNLPFHEAGHVIFGIFGQFIGSLGGTLGQLLVPLICCGAFIFKNNDPFGGAVAFWWFGENFIDMAPYINDARAGVLPLVGGNYGHSSPYGFHDWEYLLTETGLIKLDKTIASLSHLTGSILMLIALGWATLLIYLQWQHRR